MAERDVEVGLSIGVEDDSGVDLVEDLNTRLDRATKAIQLAQKQGGVRSIVAESEVKKVISLSGEINSLTSEYSKLKAEIESMQSTDAGFADKIKQATLLEDKIRAISNELRNVPNSLGQGNTQFDVGLPDTALSATSGLLSGLGNQQLGDLAGSASDILAVVDAASRLAPALTQAPGLIGAVATQGAALAAPLGAAAAGFGAIFAVVAPAAALLAVVAVAITAYNKSLEGQKQALTGALAAQENYYDALESLTTEEVEAEIQKLERALPVIQQQRDETAAAIQGVWDQAVAQFGEVGARALDAAGQLPLGDLRTRLGELDAQIQDNTQTTLRYNQGLEINAFAANDAAKAEEELAAKRQAALQNIQTLQDQADNLQANFDEQTLQMQQDRHLQEVREQEDFWRNRLRAIKQNEDAIAKIEAQGQDRLAQIHQAGVDKIAGIDDQISKLGQSLNKLASDTVKSIDKINAEFMRSEIEAIQKQQAEEEKIDKEYNKKRARLLKSLADDLLDAEAANDVVAFIARKRAGEEQLRQMAEDHDDQEQERQKAFEQERQAAEQARQARINDTLAAAEERRADIEAQRQEQIALRTETLAAIEAQKNAEIARIQAAKDATQQAFEDRLEQEDTERRIRLQREQDDYDTAEKRRQDGLKKQLDEINSKINAERQAAGLVGQAFVGMANETGAAVTNAINRIRAAASSIPTNSGYGSGGSYFGSSSSSYGGSTGGSAGGTRPFVAFDNEGTVRRPTVALLGERLKPGEVETVFKWKPSEGLDHMADNSINYHIGSIVIGNGMSAAEVDASVEKAIMAAARGTGRARRANG